MTASGAEKDGRILRAQRMRESRRAASLAVAGRVFAEKGYHRTSISDVIEAAGMARGTFYLYWESKRAIFDDLLDDLFVTLQKSLRRIDVGPGAPPPVEQMHQTVERVLQTLLEHRGMARLLLREAVGIDADFDRKLADFYGRIVAMIVSAIEIGQQMGWVRPCDATIAAHCVLGGIKEVVNSTFVERAAETITLRHLGEEMIAFTLKGLFV
jgi:AcrR family transcriptional regulator